ncbi:response regulator transcription factor [Pseudoxanthomonas winnipegensis]|uniref:Response regulator transcription factor n=1 Tax=Pseudoxanthomonas winnipegensis TaxID=2480810 RepID=A0A4Q8M0Y2_9GAMM|nr:response regulator transcription factor [Pseudoxanthomonas winnipegensis]
MLIAGQGSPSVIVLEDDDVLREEILVDGLRDYGFLVEGVSSAGALYRTMVGRQFDLGVLDLNLPDETGHSVAQRLRGRVPRMGIVMLTANPGREQHLDALKSGVDVFLRKPADLEVLALTLRNLLLRLQSTFAPATELPQAGWRLQSDGWCLVSPAGSIAPLTSSERSVMRALDQQRDNPVSRNALVEALARDVTEFDPHRLDMLIHRLRKKASALAGPEQVFPLLAARGVGYVFSR